MVIVIHVVVVMVVVRYSSYVALMVDEEWRGNNIPWMR